ncbi:MAG: type II toxin-antitoxin system VapC family toxin [Chloroflexi bacterium]|nr:type II toxin-antitoxin system VapC family toxin [Chloroflexota bacterium]
MKGAAVVVDASVAVKWVLAEEFTDRAQSLLKASLEARQPILGPPHLLVEVANALYRRGREGKQGSGITEAESKEALTQFLEYPVQLLSPRGLYQEAFEFARSHRLSSIYDSLYVVLARMEDVELWTDDRILLKAVEAWAPWVRWIGEY